MSLKKKINQLKFIYRYLKEQYGLYGSNERVRKLYNCIIEPSVRFRVEDFSQLHIGQGVFFSSFSSITVMDLVKERRDAFLRIGDRTSIGDNCDLRAAGGKIIIGDDCLVAQYVSIISTNHLISKDIPIAQADWDRTKNFINIGNDVWIGAHAVILPGVSIGNGAIIAAGSVVSQNVDEYTIVAGVPARFLRKR